MKRSKRFQLLQLRNAGQLDLFLLQQMPLYDNEIPDIVFQVPAPMQTQLTVTALISCCSKPIFISVLILVINNQHRFFPPFSVDT